MKISLTSFFPASRPPSTLTPAPHDGGLRVLLGVVPQTTHALGRVEHVHIQEDQNAVLAGLLEKKVDDFPARQPVKRVRVCALGITNKNNRFDAPFHPPFLPIVLQRDLLPIRVLQLALPSPSLFLRNVHRRERKLQGERKTEGVDLVLDQEGHYLVNGLWEEGRKKRWQYW